MVRNSEDIFISYCKTFLRKHNTWEPEMNLTPYLLEEYSRKKIEGIKNEKREMSEMEAESSSTKSTPKRVKKEPCIMDETTINYDISETTRSSCASSITDLNKRPASRSSIASSSSSRLSSMTISTNDTNVPSTTTTNNVVTVKRNGEKTEFEAERVIAAEKSEHDELLLWVKWRGQNKAGLCKTI